MRRFLRRLLRLSALAAFLAACIVVWLIHRPARHVPRLPPIDRVVHLDQGWGRDPQAPLRRAFYDTPSGASLHDLRYDWLVALERPWGRTKLATPEHLRSYGFVIDEKASEANPARLPVGFTRRFDRLLGEVVVDVSCAACHTGQLVVAKQGRRTALRIDGGPASHALASARLSRFLPMLTASLASTYLSPFKYRRFARRVLGDRYDEEKWRLHEDLGRVLESFLRSALDARDGRRHPLDPGLGRSDGLARATNALVEGVRGGDRIAAAAPVRYPALWNAWRLDGVQFARSQPMAGAILAAQRAGADTNLLDRHGRPLPTEERFRSSARVEDLYRSTRALQRLSPPRWPEDVLGPVDRARAEWGQRLFERHCASCHGVNEWPAAVQAFEAPSRGAADALWRTTLVPTAEVGTDPAAARERLASRIDLRATGLGLTQVREAFRPGFEEYRRRLSALEAEVSLRRKGADAGLVPLEDALRVGKARLASSERQIADLDLARVPAALALQIVARLSRQRHDEERGFSAEQSACLDGFGAIDLPEPVEDGYRARPLAGAWASGPYLHNGSVPTLYQLLSPQDERDERFFVSPGAFDPVEVGVDRRAGGDGFWFDTRLAGNSNVGHEFRAGYVGARPVGEPQYGVIGPALSPDERWALVEYLKVHRDPEPPADRVPADCGVR